jgi:xylose dehydrogenase (NAD/NADP)
MSELKLKWGILGAASIAKGSVIPGIRKSETGVVAAIASRDLAKATEAANELGIPKAFGSYESLLADPEIEAVYVPLPNHLHKEWTIKAAEAGKHVLCEKPFALNADEAQQMVAACETAGVHLAEAFMYRHHPRYDRIKAILHSGEIGEIRGIHSVFTSNIAEDRDNVRYHRSMGGGAIYDVGCYPISAARYILEEEPVAATVHAFFSPDHDEVDMMVAGLLEFAGGIALTFDCGMWAATRNTLEILGTLGRVEVPSCFTCHPDTNNNLYVTTAAGQRMEEIPYVNQFALQVDNFAYAVWGKQPVRFTSRDAVMNMRVIDACLQSAQEKARVSIPR